MSTFGIPELLTVLGWDVIVVPSGAIFFEATLDRKTILRGQCQHEIAYIYVVDSEKLEGVFDLGKMVYSPRAAYQLLQIVQD